MGLFHQKISISGNKCLKVFGQFFIFSDLAMDQSGYLSRTLWDFRGNKEFTDLTLICDDGSLPVHAVLLAPLFSSFGLSFLSSEEMPDCLFLVGLTTSEVYHALKDLYLQNNIELLRKALKRSSLAVKTEKLDESDLKEDITDSHNLYSDNDDVGDDLKVEVTSTEKVEIVKIEPVPLQQINNHATLQHKQIDQVRIQCNLCGESFANGQVYRKHKSEVHKMDKEEILKEWKKLNEKMKTNERSKRYYQKKIQNQGNPWNCDICGQDFPTKGSCFKHRQKEHVDELEARGLPTGRKDQQCPYCNKLYEKQLGHSRFRPTIDKHIFNVHKDKLHLHPEITPLLTCDECDTELYDKKALKEHKDVVHGENAICQICSKVTKSQSALESHMQVHAKESHICEICSMEFKCLNYLKIHHSRVHKPKVIKFPCTLCSYDSAQSETTLQKHMLDNHSGLQYLCTHCPKSFKSADGRRHHENNIYGEKTDKCEECGKLFSNKHTLKHHINIVHIKKKDKICPHCGEAFLILQSFQAHILRHTNDRQFPCEMCGKAFLLQIHLDKHIHTHTTPFMCAQCDKSFGSKMLLADHVKTKHEGIKHECRYSCGYDNWFRRQVIKHEKSCRLNPVPGAPYSVAVGTASSLTLERYHGKLNQSTCNDS